MGNYRNIDRSDHSSNLLYDFKIIKREKDYNQFERRYHSEDDYDDDYDDEEDDDEEEDDYEPEPRCRPVREQAERRTSSAPAKRRWKIILEDVDQQDQYSFIFMIRWESEGSVHRQSMTSFVPAGRFKSIKGTLRDHPKWG